MEFFTFLEKLTYKKFFFKLIISKDDESSEYHKNRIANAQGVSSQLKKSLEEYEDNSVNQD